MSSFFSFETQCRWESDANPKAPPTRLLSISLEPLQPFVEDRFDSIIPISTRRIRDS